MAEENRDEVPDTIDKLLSGHKKRRGFTRSLPNREELELWHQQPEDQNIERPVRASQT